VEAHAAVGWPAERPRPDGIVEVGRHLVLAAARDRWCEAARGLGPGTHDRGTVADVVREAGAPEAVARDLADHLVDLGVLVRVSGGVALADHVDEATRAREQRADRLVEALLAHPFAPPDLDDLVREHGLDRREVTALVGEGRVVRCGPVTFAREAIDQAVEALRPLAAGGASFTASQAKTAWGTTRRYAIPLLEHLDRTGATRFDGQTRRLVR
jgi:selenocysteine-specific elongation factor